MNMQDMTLALEVMEEDNLEVGCKYHQGERQNSQQKHQNNDKKSIQCYRYGKDGHTINHLTR